MRSALAATLLLAACGPSLESVDRVECPRAVLECRCGDGLRVGPVGEGEGCGEVCINNERSKP